MLFPGNILLPASILDFKPRLANRCKLFPVYTLFRASILDFKPRLENRCKLFSGNILLPAEFVVSTVFLVRFQFSLQQRRMARLQRLWQQRVLHPIPIFAAAKKNGPPATTDATTILRVRF